MPFAAAFVSTALAAAAIHLLVQDPAAFHAQAQEDRLLEWLSAALLLLGCGSLALAFLALHRAPDRHVYALAALAGLSLLLLVMAMEEISWGQRVLGFQTPEAIAAANWQGEFNFHNLQTDLSEAAYYSAAAVFLGFLPLLRDLLPLQFAGQPWVQLLPTRTVALVSAPVHMLSYGQWNLVPVQLATLLALFALFTWAAAASARRSYVECTVLLGLAGAVVAGQAAVLWFGAAMVDVPDASEYKEFFLAAGFACYALTASAALRARRRPAR
ncbi:MAG: hypothetical protein M3177_11325 [Pseudomonadota bacterium]|nr:hypothetical protein [Pseudomonadota bacterium]